MHWAWSDVKIIYVNRPSRSAVKSKSRLSAWKMPIIDRFCNVLRVSWLYIKRLLPRLFSFGVSAKKRNHIAETSMEYRRNVNGISPKEQRFFIEEGMAMRLFGGFSLVLIMFYC